MGIANKIPLSTGVYTFLCNVLQAGLELMTTSSENNLLLQIHCLMSTVYVCQARE